MRRAAVALLAFVLFSLVAASCSPKNSEDLNIYLPQTGYHAPDFSLPVLDGGNVSLSDSKGSAVMLYFVSSDCSFCKWEAKSVQGVYEEYQGRGVAFLGVRMPYGRNSAMRAFVVEYGWTFPVAVDYNCEVAKLYRVRGTPTTFFISRDGVICDVQIGIFSRDLEENKQARARVLDKISSGSYEEACLGDSQSQPGGGFTPKR